MMDVTAQTGFIFKKSSKRTLTHCDISTHFWIDMIAGDSFFSRTLNAKWLFEVKSNYHCLGSYIIDLGVNKNRDLEGDK